MTARAGALYLSRIRCRGDIVHSWRLRAFAHHIATMTEEHSLEQMRHTLAHLLAAAVQKHYPHAKPAIGPAIEHGFYYDFDFSGGAAPGESDLPKLEEEMRALLPAWESFSRHEASLEEVRALFKENPYKKELAEEFAREGKTLTLYTSGGFTDLCRGGHTPHPAQDINPRAFALDRVAGAYWRGDERNPMLTRIYGLAFRTPEELEAFRQQREEARARDHRKIGKAHDLFVFSDLVGPGLPLWTPRGALVRALLDEFVWELRAARGYQRVAIPHLTKRALYETSGHWEKFHEELFRITSREGKEYALKPMNCPHHTQIFARRPHSYREMPQRYAETTMVYRDEQSGELGGLTRVLSITQDDSHVFCRHAQIKEEFFSLWDMVDTFYQTFGFSLRVRLSFHDTEHPEQYLGSKAVWEKAERALREIAEERRADFFEARGEAALYGPKLDFMAQDSLGRAHQVATIQLDLNLPERFDLFCINEKGAQERIAMIHCAIMGSLERFIAVLLEHYAGALPLWLSPVQVKILPISDEAASYAARVEEALRQKGIRTVVDGSKETLGKRIRLAKEEKVPFLAVVGNKEASRGTLAVETRGAGRTEEKMEDFAARVAEAVRTRANIPS